MEESEEKVKREEEKDREIYEGRALRISKGRDVAKRFPEAVFYPATFLSLYHIPFVKDE